VDYIIRALVGIEGLPFRTEEHGQGVWSAEQNIGVLGGGLDCGKKLQMINLG
jgi:hypothetical protein